MILWTILIPKLWVYFNQTRHSIFIWYAHIYLNDFQGERSRLRQIWDKKQDVLCINCQWDYVPSQSTYNPFSKNFMLIWNIIYMIKYINRLNLYINLKQILHFSNTSDILQSLYTTGLKECKATGLKVSFCPYIMQILERVILMNMEFNHFSLLQPCTDHS